MSTETRGRARFGVLVPFTNTNLEPDMAMLCPDGVSIHVARIGGYDVDAVPDEDQMAGLGSASLDEPLRLLAGAKPDVILYGCTSATLSHGTAFDRNLAAKIQAVSGAHSVTAAGSLVMALNTLGVRRIGFASPYVKSLNDAAISFLAESGFETLSRADYSVALGNYGQGELSPDAVLAHALKADAPDTEALVLSCTDMRSTEIITRLEAATGKPVITSNQAIVFNAMTLLGMPTGNMPFGRLFQIEAHDDRKVAAQ